MKKNFILIAVAMVFATSQLSAQLTLIQYWNFNAFTLTGSAADVVSNPISGLSTDYSVSPSNAGLVSYTVFGVTSPATYLTYWDANIPNGTPGTTVNQRDANGTGTIDISGNGLRLRNPCDQMQLILKIPSMGYRNLILNYDCQRSSASKGATINNYSYSVDNGVNWITSGLSVTSNLTSDTWSLLTVSINDTNADNNSNLLFKVTFSGGVITGTSGNNRFDNITVEGTAIGITAAISDHLSNEIATTLSPDKNGIVNFNQVVDAVVYNMQAKQLKSVSRTNQLYTTDLAKGIYIVRLNGTASKKLIIR